MKLAFVVVSLQLMLTCSQDAGGVLAVDEDITSTQCQNFKVLMVHNSSTGMLVTLASTLKNTTVTLSERNLSNHYLPPECGANNYRCSILHFVRSETSYYIIPSIRGFLILSHSTNYTDQEEFRDHVLFVPITEKQCNPTKAFYTGIYVVIACMNLPTGSDGEIFYLRYDFTIPSDDNMGNTVLTDTTFKSEPIYNTMTVSEVIFITKQEQCQSTRNLYFIDDKYVVHSPSSLFSGDFVFSTEALQECVGYLEYYGDDIIVIRCTTNKTVLYDTCGAGDFNYQPHDHIPYPCSSWSMIAYHNHTQVSLNRSGEVYVTEAFPFENISYGRCVQGADEPVFIASSADGAIFITRFDGNNFTKITSGNDNGPCLRPVFSENELIFGVCDSRSGSYMIINVTEGCAGDPVIAQIHIPIVPDLVSVSLGQGTYNCSCSTSIQNFELPSTTQMESALEATQTEGSTSYTTPTAESDAKPTVATNPIVLSAWLGPLSFGVVLIGLAVFVFIIYRVCRKCRLKTKEAYLPNMESQQESHITAGSPRHFDIGLGRSSCYERCGSSNASTNASTNTSLSEMADGNIIVSSTDEQIPCLEESQWNGGGHVLSNNGSLPYTSGQLTPQTLHNHHQQRTLNNDAAARVDHFYEQDRRNR